jgi:hypothetical protein
MAGKAKSLYLSIVDRKTHKTVLHKQFFEAKSLNEFLKDETLREKYPNDQYQFVKETY